MPLHLDGIIFNLQRQGGISVYFRELVQRLDRDAKPYQLTVERPTKSELPHLHAEPVYRPARALERYRSARPASKSGQQTVFHSSYYRRPIDRSTASVVTIHDFAYERLQRGPRKWIHSWQKFSAIRQAQHLICISAATRDDLIELVGVRQDQQVHIVPNGVSEIFSPIASERSDATDRPFVLFVGQRGGYKNFKTLLEAFSQLPADIELHCVGGGPLSDQELLAISPEIRSRIKHLGYVDDLQLNRCYNKALCLAYVSRYEGFGIPIIEAMKAGCPVVSIACKAVLEVGAEALSVAEDAAESLAAAIMNLTRDSERDRLRKLGFRVAERYSWEQTYIKTLNVYKAAGAVL